MEEKTTKINAEEIRNERAKHKIQNLPGTENWELNCKKLSEIEPGIQPWLWDKIIPLQTFTLFAGIGGIGKSQLLMFIAARVSDGLPFEAGGKTHKMEQGSVLILSGEDHENYQLKPRLMAQNALDNIYLTKSVSNKFNQKSKRLLALDQDLDLIREKLKQIGDVKLIIIDPVMNFIGNTKDHISSEVLSFLAGLNEIAEEFNLAIILNKHLRKQSSGSNADSAINEVSGSGSWVNNARQSWIICEDREDYEKKYFINLKLNIEKRHKEAFGFKIIGVEVNYNNLIIPTAKIEWSDKMESITADEAVNKQYFDLKKEEQIGQFIINYLSKSGEKLSSDVLREAKENGIKESTYFKIRANLIKNGQIQEKFQKTANKKRQSILYV